MRLFPATARQRLVVAATAIALGVGGATTQIAHADIKHLRHQQSQAQHSVKHAQADLDESSGQARRAYAALTSSRANLRAARHDLQVARDHVQSARHQLNKTRRQLERAKERLARAEANLAQEQQAVDDQREPARADRHRLLRGRRPAAARGDVDARVDDDHRADGQAEQQQLRARLPRPDPRQPQGVGGAADRCRPTNASRRARRSRRRRTRPGRTSRSSARTARRPSTPRSASSRRPSARSTL